jgi:hypothetical protein
MDFLDLGLPVLTSGRALPSKSSSRWVGNGILFPSNRIRHRDCGLSRSVPKPFALRHLDFGIQNQAACLRCVLQSLPVDLPDFLRLKHQDRPIKFPRFGQGSQDHIDAMLFTQSFEQVVVKIKPVFGLLQILKAFFQIPLTYLNPFQVFRPICKFFTYKVSGHQKISQKGGKPGEDGGGRQRLGVFLKADEKKGFMNLLPVAFYLADLLRILNALKCPKGCAWFLYLPS